MSVYDYDLLDNISQTTGTKILTPLSAYRNVPFGDFPSGIPNNLRGFVVISISCSNPNYRSLLKYFHWGLTPLQYG